MITLIIPKGEYTNGDAIDNVINYMFDSRYASNITAGGFGILNTDTQAMIDNFYLTQNCFYKTDGKRIYHMVLSFDDTSNLNIDAKEIAQEVSDYIGQEFQNVYTIHNRSKKNPNNYHIHFAINSVNYNNGLKLRATEPYYYGIVNCIASVIEYSDKVSIIYKKDSNECF